MSKNAISNELNILMTLKFVIAPADKFVILSS